MIFLASWRGTSRGARKRCRAPCAVRLAQASDAWPGLRHRITFNIGDFTCFLLKFATLALVVAVHGLSEHRGAAAAGASAAACRGEHKPVIQRRPPMSRN